MTETLLHVSDSLTAVDGPGTDSATSIAGGLDTVVRFAIERNVDAVVHTGNLFRNPDPAMETVDAVRGALADLADAAVPVFVIAGARESHGESDPLEEIRAVDGIRQLSETPTTVGDVALFGIGHVDSAETFEARLGALEPAADFSYNVVCVHRRIWPPFREFEADVSAFDLMEATPVFVDEVLAGGCDTHRVWESDDYAYRVSYAGSTNPESLDAGETTGATLLRADTDGSSHERVPLTDTGVGEELAQLRDALAFQPADVDGVDVATLADLYGLAARAKSVYEGRRKALRDELLERVDEDGSIRGEYATVDRTTQRRRSLKA